MPPACQLRNPCTRYSPPRGEIDKVCWSALKDRRRREHEAPSPCGYHSLETEFRSEESRSPASDGWSGHDRGNRSPVPTPEPNTDQVSRGPIAYDKREVRKA